MRTRTHQRNSAAHGRARAPMRRLRQLRPVAKKESAPKRLVHRVTGHDDKARTRRRQRAGGMAAFAGLAGIALKNRDRLKAKAGHGREQQHAH